MERDFEDRPRVFVPVELASFLRAPYGWTNRMRRAEGWPEPGVRRPVHLGFWRSLALALALYGPWLLGAGLGWRAMGHTLGALVGAIIGFGVQITVGVFVAPIVGIVRGRRADRGSTSGPADGRA